MPLTYERAVDDIIAAALDKLEAARTAALAPGKPVAASLRDMLTLISSAGEVDPTMIERAARAWATGPQKGDLVTVTARIFTGREPVSFTGEIIEVRSAGPLADRPGKRFKIKQAEGVKIGWDGWYSAREIEPVGAEAAAGS